MVQVMDTSLALMVSNAQLLEGGKKVQFVWSNNNGTIGSCTSDTWRLQDRMGKVNKQHCEVLFIDHDFCIRDLSGETYINGSLMPIGEGKLVKLKHKDTILIGNLCVRAQVGKRNRNNSVDSDLDTLLYVDQESFSSNQDTIQEVSAYQASRNCDPLMILDSKQKNSTKSDMAFVETSSTQILVPECVLSSHTEYSNNLPPYSFQMNSPLEITSSIALKENINSSTQRLMHSAAENCTCVLNHSVSEIYRSSVMDQKEVDPLEDEYVERVSPAVKTSSNEENSVSHLVSGPILHGLGINISQFSDMHRMQQLSHEFGESIQACIRGLIALHNQMQIGRYGSLNTTLQPIEDNPLRLGLGYEETVRTMYDTEKSVVHLSAPAAIAESLQNISLHNSVAHAATSEALSRLLEAFSPQVLMKRFQRYRRSTENSALSNEAWAWEMYCNYYQELTSHRQNGFEKLFWEIFEQSFDTQIRDRHRSNDYE